jgi:hypothetical protein
MKAQLSPKEWTLLSTYVDGRLSPQETKDLEEKLRLSAPLRHALEDLKYTRSLLQSLPHKRAPRSFALTPAMLPKRHPWFKLAPAFGFSSALAGILTVLTFAFNFIQPAMPLAMAPSVSDAQKGVALESSSPSTIPPIITWKSYAEATVAAGGYGGGNDSPGGEITVLVVATPPPAFRTVNPSDAYPSSEDVGNPILGINTGETATALPDATTQIVQDETRLDQPDRLLLPVVLAITTLLTGIAAILLRRKSAA